MCRYSRSLPPRKCGFHNNVSGEHRNEKKNGLNLRSVVTKSLKLTWQELSPVASGERRSSWSFDTQPASNSSSRSKNDLVAVGNRPLSWLIGGGTPKKHHCFFQQKICQVTTEDQSFFKTTSYSQYFIFTNLLPSILSKRLAFLPLLQTHQNQLLGVPNVWMSLEQW